MRNTNYYLRQNHKKAITYLKSSQYCFRREKLLMYFVIGFSITFCFLGLVFSMLPVMLKNPAPNFIKVCSNTVSGIGFASGMFLVIQMLLKAIMTRLHIDGVNSIERFDMYVYEMPANRLIMRPLPEAQLENNSIKIRSKDTNYTNTYFQHETEEDPLEVYKNQREILVNEYHLMTYIKSRFLNFAWASALVIIFFFAVVANQNFFTTLLNIFFPSISIISLIVSSMLSYRQSMVFLQNALTYFEAAEKDHTLDKRCDIMLRQNQDAIFTYRMNSFNVPMFLIRRYEKSAAKQRRDALLTDEIASAPKTSPYITRDAGFEPIKTARAKRKNNEATVSNIDLAQSEVAATDFGIKKKKQNPAPVTEPEEPAVITAPKKKQLSTAPAEIVESVSVTAPKKKQTVIAPAETAEPISVTTPKKKQKSTNEPLVMKAPKSLFKKDDDEITDTASVTKPKTKK